MKLINSVSNAVIATWIVMLLLGGIHSEFDSRIPAPGFWGTMLALYSLVFVSALVRAEATYVKPRRSA